MRTGRIIATVAAGLALFGQPSFAASPYAGLEGRSIKALAEDEIDDLRAGRGMGLALAAELNGYPGPRHVLDHAAELALSAEQWSMTERLFAEMEAGAIALGERVIEEEAALDRLFAHRHADPAGIAARTAAIGRLTGELRAHHLGYHLRMAALLSEAQIERYTELRGYASGHPPAGRHGPHRR